MVRVSEEVRDVEVATAARQAHLVSQVIVGQHAQPVPHRQAELLVSHAVGRLRGQHRQPRAAVCILAQGAKDGLLVASAAGIAAVIQRELDALSQALLQLACQHEWRTLGLLARTARLPARCRRCSCAELGEGTSPEQGQPR